jgi:hypothetical protein
MRRGGPPSRWSPDARFLRRGDEWVEDDGGHLDPSDRDAVLLDEDPEDVWDGPDMNWKLRTLRNGAPAATALAVRRPGDGVTAFGLGPDHAARIVRWSAQAAARERAVHPERVAGGEAPGGIPALLKAADHMAGGAQDEHASA